MEIERKFLIRPENLPDHLESFPAKELKQGYILHSPALRIRKESELPAGKTAYIMTYKGSGGLSRQEINIPLPEEAGEKLFSKCEGHLIEKTRYLIQSDASDHSTGRPLIVELDVFHGEFSGLIYAEVEFDTEDSARSYLPPEWFGSELTGIRGFSNSDLSRYGMPDVSF